MKKKNNWSLIEKEWNLLRETLAPYKWKRTDLDKLYRDKVPSKPGVYIICSNPPHNFGKDIFPKLYNALYVGKSDKSLRVRFLNHCQNPKDELAETKKVFNYKIDYWYTEVPLDSVDDVETIIIDCFGPSVNSKRGQGSIKIRLKDPVPA